MSATTTSTTPHHPTRKTISNNNTRNRPPHPSNPNQPPPNQRKRSNNQPQKSKRNGPLDFIDTLDTIGGFHHDGPFDAASSHRNRNTNSKNPSRQAPMAAFDPSALVMPPPSQPQSSSIQSNSSSSSTPQPDSEHLYPPPHLNHRASDSTIPISMGYPAGMIASDPKAAKLAEAFGIQGREAWEDFGMERKFVAGKPTRAGSTPGPDRKVSREERDAKTASVWDMEATLRSGRPVPSEEPVDYRSNSGEMEQPYNFQGNQTGQSIKRSKSLMQRIKKGVKSPASNSSSSEPNQLSIQESPEDGLANKLERHNLRDDGLGEDDDVTGRQEADENPGDLRNQAGRRSGHQSSKSYEFVNSTSNSQQAQNQPQSGISRKTSLLMKFGLAKSKTNNRS
ncbi:hypothetical protein BY996DRAFT_7556653 [Phakopsora pachyrhizi]|uniref:Expressed protein n=1 Tax=Phakopsora pachyrhizi TaxID=170000 RepID=A0AAV0BCX8_PHAPC|nr:hypothetical protein BY996DRAFT_7556653 [Phakopsora pachyrhizi]CAH7683723.1 expressed protein [Phakopsora pachyrhizi]